MAGYDTNDIPIREHMRRRGVEPTVTDDEATDSSELDPRAGRKRKRGGFFPKNMKKMVVPGVQGDAITGPGEYDTEPDPNDPDEGSEGEAEPTAAPAAEPNFGELLFGNTDIPHELKLAIMQKYDMANSRDPGSIKALHESIYGSGLPGELKDKLAQMRSYADNVNRNPAKRGVPDMASAGPSDSLDPRTGQAWDKGIGPSLRKRLLQQAATQKEIEAQKPSGAPQNFGPAYMPEKQMGAPSAPPSGPIYAGQTKLPEGNPNQIQTMPNRAPNGIPPQLIAWLQAMKRQGGV